METLRGCYLTDDFALHHTSPYNINHSKSRIHWRWVWRKAAGSWFPSPGSGHSWNIVGGKLMDLIVCNLQFSLLYCPIVETKGDLLEGPTIPCIFISFMPTSLKNVLSLWYMTTSFLEVPSTCTSLSDTWTTQTWSPPPPDTYIPHVGTILHGT